MKAILIFVFCLAFFDPGYLSAQPKQKITVGAKHFNEGYILSEMIAILLEDAGFVVERKFNLGGTAVAFEALKNGAIDIYPEYTGTITAEILKADERLSRDGINKMVGERFDLEVSRPYGFNNAYALVMLRRRAEDLQIDQISDLRNHPRVRAALSYEFLKRRDGWEALSSFYDLPQDPVGLEHGLAYQALLGERIDITDAYSTDGEIVEYDFTLLVDDQRFFPEYQAVSFYDASLPDDVKRILDKLSGAISQEEMQSLNAQALFEERSHAEIALGFMTEKKLVAKQGQVGSEREWEEIVSKTLVHLQLTLIALLAAVIVALPLGICVYKRTVLSRAILYFAGMLQTIPSIALLALMIPLVGIGIIPALVALFLYALLPILRNTVIGLTTVDPQLTSVASAIGLNEQKRLKLVELPLAMPTILAGIRTAAVINVGTATLAAFIGAGGLGEFIVTGLALNNTALILKGAIPAAILAILIELLFEALEMVFIPAHLRRKTL